MILNHNTCKSTFNYNIKWAIQYHDMGYLYYNIYIQRTDPVKPPINLPMPEQKCPFISGSLIRNGIYMLPKHAKWLQDTSVSLVRVVPSSKGFLVRCSALFECCLRIMLNQAIWSQHQMGWTRNCGMLCLQCLPGISFISLWSLSNKKSLCLNTCIGFLLSWTNKKII